MIAEWMAYAVLMGACSAVAAIALEPLFAERGHARRAPWIGAMLATALTPLLAAIRPVATPNSVSSVTLASAVPVPSGIVPAATGWSFDEWLLLAWATGSLAMLIAIGTSAWRIERAGARGRHTILDGERVALTENAGPGARGFGFPRILVPAWLVSLEPARRALLVRHEQEHVRAGDPTVLLVTLAVLATMPWNLALWYIARRLRAALELDCDARVLARGGDVLAYGELLLTVAARRRAPTMSAYLAFASPPSFLERRIRAMTSPHTSLSAGRKLGFLSLAAVAVVAACETRRPEPLAPVSSYTIEGGKASATALPTGAQGDSVRGSLASILQDRVPASALAGNANDPLLLVFDAEGTLLTSRRIGTRAPGAAPGIGEIEYPPESIASVDVNKAAHLLPPEARGGIIRVVLKPGVAPATGTPTAVRPRAEGDAPAASIRLRGSESTEVFVRDSEGRELYRAVLAVDPSGAERNAFDRVPVNVTDIATVEVNKAAGTVAGSSPNALHITLKPGKGLRPAR